MKNGLLVILTIFLWSKSYSQPPPNLLGRSEDTIKSYMSKLWECSVEKKYSNYGTPYLYFVISDFKLATKLNSRGNSIYIAFFVLGIENNCSECNYLYADQSNDLESIVNSMNGNLEFSKKVGQFGWESKQYSFDAIIKKDSNNPGFEFGYKWLEKARNRLDKQ